MSFKDKATNAQARANKIMGAGTIEITETQKQEAMEDGLKPFEGRMMLLPSAVQILQNTVRSLSLYLVVALVILTRKHYRVVLFFQVFDLKLISATILSLFVFLTTVRHILMIVQRRSSNDGVLRIHSGRINRRI